MSHRISLTRIVAINWYGFRQIIDVADNVLISGAFGTGKSALLDLLQYVLLGEHWRANRAASGNARGRDLVGYCLGDTNQTRNGQRHFLRADGVTLVALEFTRAPEKGRPIARETWGIRLEYSSAEAAPKHTYFCIPDRVEYAQWAPNDQLLSDDQFRTWLRREFGHDSLFARQRDYLEEMAAPRHLNFDVAAFQRTFPKAIAFEPEENVERFIREFILEECPLDVRDVRASLRAYQDTRQRLLKQEDEAAYLRRIAAFHASYHSARRQQALWQHAAETLRLLQADERRSHHAATLQRLQAEHADDVKELERLQRDGAQTEKLLNDVRFEVQKDPGAVEFDRLHRTEREQRAVLGQLQTARRSAHERLDDRHRAWTLWLRHAEALRGSLPGIESAAQVESGTLMQLTTGSDALRLQAMVALAQSFHQIWNRVRDLLRPAEEEVRQLATRREQLDADLEHLAQGRAPGSFPLYQALRAQLGQRVEQLGRLIEVKAEAETWWPALELYLGADRWALVLESERDVAVALDLLRRTAPGREAERLLIPAEVRRLTPEPQAGSLFELVEVVHPTARVVVAHLLGSVQRVETAEALEKHPGPRALTPDGLLKDAPWRRRLRPSGAVDLTLGREGLQRMRLAKEKEREQISAQHELGRRRIDDIHAWLERGRTQNLGDATLPDRAAELPHLPQLESDLARTTETLRLLQTPERDARQQRLQELEDTRRDQVSRIAVLLERQNRFELTARPERESLARAEEAWQQARLAQTEVRVRLSREFPDVRDTALAGLCDPFVAAHPTWNERVEALHAAMQRTSEEAVEARAQRRSEREKLASAREETGQFRHPEYQHDFAVDDDSNAAWDARLRLLETIELSKSRELAADRQQDWERRLQENVLNELQRRITEAQNTIRLLDKYLSQPIGRFRYRLSQRRDTAGFGALWRLLDTGLEPTDPLAAAIQENELRRAQEELMQAVNASDGSDERARRLLDYRNYHHYDLEMVPADQPEAPPISLGRSGRNLSGGENQAPFFISMLAAFRRVYDRGDRASTFSQQLGLVVMDEAFSKLSGDGIEDCLALARSFQLQLIMAFPPERLGVMVPHAQTVMMCLKEVERDAAGYVTRIDNIPWLMTMSEAVAALETV